MTETDIQLKTLIAEQFQQNSGFKLWAIDNFNKVYVSG